MTTEIKMSLNNGNAKTVFLEEANTSPFFWDNILTQCLFYNKDNFHFENSFDLMGNALSKGNSKKIRKPLSKA